MQLHFPSQRTRYPAPPADLFVFHHQQHDGRKVALAICRAFQQPLQQVQNTTRQPEEVTAKISYAADSIAVLLEPPVQRRCFAPRRRRQEFQLEFFAISIPRGMSCCCCGLARPNGHNLVEVVSISELEPFVDAG